ncbi:MAG: Holliday junction branch migration protein RuvA [Phycisphaerae bacterium]
MIARIAGRLEEVRKGAVLVDTGGGLWYEVLVPACDVERLSRRLGQDLVLHTIHFLEGDPSHGQQTPRLLGFLAEEDREFFWVFTTVKGVGIRKGLRALARRPAEVATAIQNKDAKFLKSLPEIGPRMAERIVTELHDKVGVFVEEAAVTTAGGEEIPFPEAASEALAVLVQLGEKRADAAALVERVLAIAPEASSPEEIIQHVYRLKAGAAK